MKVVAALLFLAAGTAAAVRAQGLPAVLVPPENPITEQNRVLGKILFWDERLSYDRTVACGTCHVTGRSGTDPRIAIHPGPDATFGTPDDVRASLGVVRADEGGHPIEDPLFGFLRQVTRRSAPAAVGAAHAPLLFWDGRAAETFVDPETELVSLVSRGALESQAVAPLMNTAEMAHDGRTWNELRRELAVVEPLGYATRLPADVASAVAAHATYPDLFEQAFGDPAITAERIAFAIATYERTLVADQTPWDRFVAGDPNALTPGQRRGWDFFRTSNCSICHAPPFFTNNSFRAIGVRPPVEDGGRQEVTGLFADRGRFKVPTLRGVGRKATYMHNGQFSTLQDVIAFYRPNNPQRFPDNVDPLLPVPVPSPEQPPLIDFLANALTDPRMAAEQFPFDRPTLHAGAMQTLLFDPDHQTLRWPPLLGVPSYAIYRGSLSDLARGEYGDCMNAADPDPADTVFFDPDTPRAGEGFFYLKAVRDGTLLRGLGVSSSGAPRVPRSPCG